MKVLTVAMNSEQIELAHKLYKDLSPHSDFHGRQDRTENLRRIVIEVQALFVSLPTNIQQQYAPDMTLGVGGILRDTSTSKPEKIELNWEDDADVESYL